MMIRHERPSRSRFGALGDFERAALSGGLRGVAALARRRCPNALPLTNVVARRMAAVSPSPEIARRAVAGGWQSVEADGRSGRLIAELDAAEQLAHAALFALVEHTAKRRVGRRMARNHIWLLSRELHLELNSLVAFLMAGGYGQAKAEIGSRSLRSDHANSLLHDALRSMGFSQRRAPPSPDSVVRFARQASATHLATGVRRELQEIVDASSAMTRSVDVLIFVWQGMSADAYAAWSRAAMQSALRDEPEANPLAYDCRIIERARRLIERAGPAHRPRAAWAEKGIARLADAYVGLTGEAIGAAFLMPRGKPAGPGHEFISIVQAL